MNTETIKSFRESGIPYIDESVEHIGVSVLRRLNGYNLRAMSGACVIHDYAPIAVLMRYEDYLSLQEAALRNA